MESHVRIDEGVKRGPRRLPPPNPRDPDTGQMLPLIPYHERQIAIQNAAHRVSQGEPLKDIAADIGVTMQCLSLWLLDECPDEYRTAQRRGLIQRIIIADKALEDASGPLDLARAREQARFARWDAERRLPKLFGQHQHITLELTGDLGDKLRRAKERTVDGEVVAIQGPDSVA